VNRRARPVLCDRCGRPLPSIAIARVRTIFDARDALEQLALVHAHEASAADREAALFADLGSPEVGRLRRLARYPGASVTRLLRKIRALAALTSAGVPA
jgi:hypothetical protein